MVCILELYETRNSQLIATASWSNGDSGEVNFVELTIFTLRVSIEKRKLSVAAVCIGRRRGYMINIQPIVPNKSSPMISGCTIFTPTTTQRTATGCEFKLGREPSGFVVHSPFFHRASFTPFLSLDMQSKQSVHQ